MSRPRVDPQEQDDDDVSLYFDAGAFSLPSWRRRLTLATLYGWTPAGTQAPDDDSLLGMHGTPDWDGRYFPGVGQHVTEADARALAEALERALPDLPDREAFERLPQP